MVVTGANRGLGLEVVRQCAADGNTVLLGTTTPGRTQPTPTCGW
ncbi:MAG: hypothetical protein QOE32_7340, partial [Pseudonocardiales bacterium]|nr:hypothetical protein [Pseudonocardiales bacterium]